MAFKMFLLLFNPFVTAKISKLDFRDANNSTNLKDQQLNNHKRNVHQPTYHHKAYCKFFKNVYKNYLY